MEELNNDFDDEANESLPDETSHLRSTEANRKALDESIQQIEAGKGIKVSIEDLWK